MTDNLVFLHGRVGAEPYFNRVKNSKGATAFLCFLLRVKRDSTMQDSPSAYPHDSIRVVAYGSLAERIYAVIERDTEAFVVGWIQSRRLGETTILEVVSLRISCVGQGLISHETMARIETLARKLNLEMSEVVELLLEPQLVAMETGLHEEA